MTSPRFRLQNELRKFLKSWGFCQQWDEVPGMGRPSHSDSAIFLVEFYETSLVFYDLAKADHHSSSYNSFCSPLNTVTFLARFSLSAFN